MDWRPRHVTPHVHSVPASPETSQCRSLSWDVLSHRRTFCPVRLFGGGRLVVAWDVLLYVRAARWERYGGYWHPATTCLISSWKKKNEKKKKKKSPTPTPARVRVRVCLCVCARVTVSLSLGRELLAPTERSGRTSDSMLAVMVHFRNADRNASFVTVFANFMAERATAVAVRMRTPTVPWRYGTRRTWRDVLMLFLVGLLLVRGSWKTDHFV